MSGRTPGTIDMILHGPVGNFVNRTPIPEEDETPPARRRRFSQGSMIGYDVCQMKKFAFQDSSLPSERGGKWHRQTVRKKGEKPAACCLTTGTFRNMAAGRVHEDVAQNEQPWLLSARCSYVVAGPLFFCFPFLTARKIQYLPTDSLIISRSDKKSYEKEHSPCCEQKENTCFPRGECVF